MLIIYMYISNVTVYVLHDIDMSIAYMYVHTRETPSLTKVVANVDILGGSRKFYIQYFQYIIFLSCRADHNKRYSLLTIQKSCATKILGQLRHSYQLSCFLLEYPAKTTLIPLSRTSTSKSHIFHFCEVYGANSARATI